MKGVEISSELKGCFRCRHREDGDNNFFKDEHNP